MVLSSCAASFAVKISLNPMGCTSFCLCRYPKRLSAVHPFDRAVLCDKVMQFAEHMPDCIALSERAMVIFSTPHSGGWMHRAEEQQNNGFTLKNEPAHVARGSFSYYLI